MKRLVTSIIFLFAAITGDAQVNAYAKVTSVSSTTLNITSPNETYASFTAGDQLIIMQMQDNVIGTTTNNSNFGSLSTIASAGNYEVAVIASVVRSGGTVTQININSPLAKTFNTGSNSSVQVISYPLLGTNGYTTTANISALPWNGSTGGVVAFRVNGTLTLAHNITADNAGFRGGASNAGTASSCDASTYTSASAELYANKGEGIYKATASSYSAGRGRILNGGGGGNTHNAGGGGGSNLSAGGEGGKGYSCSSNAGGLGGLSLSSFISSEKVFMGGGGGAGEGNNGYNTAGGNGGGIIIIKATQIITTGSGAALRLSANGQTAGNVGNDGAGGGGAGGSLMLNVQSWNIASSKPLTITANGGTGGTVTDATAHGGGAGGGQGTVIFSTAIPTSNITTTTLNGRGGRNNAGGTYAENGQGSDNVGINSSSFALLPLYRVSFKGSIKKDDVHLEWYGDNEQQVKQYQIQRSIDGTEFKTIGIVQAVNNNAATHKYDFTDRNKRGSKIFYRLTIIDKQQQQMLSNVVLIKDEEEESLHVSIQPNPIQQNGVVNIISPISTRATIRIINAFGVAVETFNYHLVRGSNTVTLHNVNRFNNGHYQLLVSAGSLSKPQRFVIAR